MIVLDFLFKICYAPFQKEPRGKLIATFWLTPPLAFIFGGAFNILLYLLKPILDIDNTPTLSGIVGLSLAGLIAFLLHRVYVQNDRSVGKIRFVVLHALLIPVLIFGSIVLFAMSFRYR